MNKITFLLVGTLFSLTNIYAQFQFDVRLKQSTKLNPTHLFKKSTNSLPSDELVSYWDRTNSVWFSPQSEITYSYDSKGRILKKVDCNPSTKDTNSFELISYDDNQFVKVRKVFQKMNSLELKLYTLDSIFYDQYHNDKGNAYYFADSIGNLILENKSSWQFEYNSSGLITKAVSNDFEYTITYQQGLLSGVIIKSPSINVKYENIVWLNNIAGSLFADDENQVMITSASIFKLENNNWVDSAVIGNFSNDNNRGGSAITSLKINNTLVPYSRQTCSFDSHNKSILSQTEIYESGNWSVEYGEKNEYLYDLSDNIIQRTHSYCSSTDSGKYVNSSLHKYSNFIQVTNGIKAFSNVGNAISIFPNPSKGILNLKKETQYLVDIKSLEIFDINGKSVNKISQYDFDSDGLVQIDTQMLEQGVYLISFSDLQGNHFYEKFIKSE